MWVIECVLTPSNTEWSGVLQSRVYIEVCVCVCGGGGGGCLVETHGFTLLVFVNKLFGLCFCFQNVHLGCVFLFGMFVK